MYRQSAAPLRPQPVSRLALAALLGVVALVGLFQASTIRAGHDWGDDFAVYIQHARNIAQGVDYRSTRFIYNPAFPIQPPAYPPVLPLLLAPVYRIAGLNLDAMKLALIPCFLAALLVLAWLWRDRLSPPGLIAAIAVVGFNPYFWSFKDNVLSDIPFLLFTLLALAAVERAATTDGAPRLPAAALVAVCVALAWGTRNAGLVLVPTVVVYDVLRWRRLTWLSGLTVLVVGALYTLQRLTLGELGGALLFSLSPVDVAANAARYVQAFGVLWWNGVNLPLAVLLMAVLLALAAVAYFGRLREGVTVVEVFIPLYLALILVWNSFQGPRFLIPISPLIVCYAFEGLERLGRWGRAGQRALSLFTERRATSFHALTDDQQFLAYLGSVNADYLVLGPDDMEAAPQSAARRVVALHPDRFELVYRNADFQVYHVAPGAT